MPERVTKEERIVSLAIEKARSAKEELLASLKDNNRSDLEKDNIILAEMKADKDAHDALIASAKAKLMSGEAMTEEEANITLHL